MRVEEVSGADAHVADQLALYHLDALDERSGERVGRHLESCAECRAAAVEVCETIAALALLTDQSEDVLNQYGALGSSVATAFPERFAPQELPDQPDRLIHRLAVAAESRRRRRRGKPSEEPAAPAMPEGNAAPGKSAASAASRPALAPKSELPVPPAPPVPPVKSGRPAAVQPPVAPAPPPTPPPSRPAATPVPAAPAPAVPEPVSTTQDRQQKEPPPVLRAAKEPPVVREAKKPPLVYEVNELPPPDSAGRVRTTRPDSPQSKPVLPPLPAQRPEPPTARPEPLVARPEPVAARPEARVARPEPPVTRPDSVVARPETRVTRPAPVARPEPLVARSEPVVARLEPVVSRPAPVAEPVRPPNGAAPSRPPAPSKPHRSAGPPGAAKGSRRPGERRRRSATIARLTGLLMLAVALAGFSVFALVSPEKQQQTAAELSAAATATDQQTGATLSVHVTEGSTTVSVRATVTGLEDGVGYRLYGYPFDGRPRPVVNWTGKQGVEEVTGELSLAIADLSHFTVMRGGRVVVTVYLPRTVATK